MEILKSLLDSGEYAMFEGWCTPEKALFLYNLVNDNCLDVCVELGVFGGKSLLPIALACKGKVYGIDSWSKDACLEGKNDVANDEWWAKVDLDSIFTFATTLLNKYTSNVRLLRDKSLNVLDTFAHESIDLLHQDSNHSEEISCSEVEAYTSKLKSGGYWVFDDINWETTKKAQDLLESKGFTKIHDFNSWAVYKKN